MNDRRLYEEQPGKRLKPPRLTKKGIHDLAVDIVTNVVYIANDKDATLSFPVLLMADRKTLPMAVLRRTGAIYEERRLAGPTGINGRPMFMSCRLLHKDDLDPLLTEIERIEKALK